MLRLGFVDQPSTNECFELVVMRNDISGEGS